MPKTEFKPETHGFHFINSVFNVRLIPLKGLPPVPINGLCGGMSFTVLDHFFNGMPIPPFTGADFAASGGVPPDGSPLTRYIFNRQVDSFVPGFITFAAWTFTPDQSFPGRPGLTQLTKQVEFPKLKKSIDKGQPVTLGLIWRGGQDLAKNHQVVACGYDEDDPASEAIKVYIYDVNHPDEEIVLFSDKSMPGFDELNGSNEKWRGFFVQQYQKQKPPTELAVLPGIFVSVAKGMALEAAPTKPRRAPRTRVAVTLKHISFERQAKAEVTGEIALLIRVNNKNVRWPKKGLQRVTSGRRYRLNERIELSVSDARPLTISATMADRRGRPITPMENGKSIGTLFVLHNQADKWGKGAHKVRSTGKAGAYTLEYKVDVVKPAT